MKRKRVKMEITVTEATKFHLKHMCKENRCSPGYIIDKLVRDRMLGLKKIDLRKLPEDSWN